MNRSMPGLQSPLKPMSIESVMPSNHLILCRPLLLLPSIPASGSFPTSQLFTPGGQSIGVSASTSVLPRNTQDRSPLRWTGWISLQSEGLSRVFSNTTVLKHQFFFFFITEILLVVLRITTQTFQFVHNSSHTYQKSKISCSCDS